MVIIGCDDLPYGVRYAGDQGIAHAEGAMPVTHPRIGPSSGEHLKPVEFVGDESAYPPVAHGDRVFRSAWCRTATFDNANGDLKPDKVRALSNRTVSWVCPKGHKWKPPVRMSIRKTCRPVCDGTRKPTVPGRNDPATPSILSL